MDTPAACVVPNDATRGKVMVSSLVNPTFSSVEGLRRYAVDVASGDGPETAMGPNYDEVLSEYLTTWPNKLSAQATVEALVDLAADEGRLLCRSSSRFALSGDVTEPDPSIDPALMTPEALASKLAAICERLGVSALPRPRKIAAAMILFEPLS